MEPIRAYRYYQLSKTGNLQGLLGTNWRERRLIAKCRHTPELVECMCGIYGLYDPSGLFGEVPVLACCLFYGRTVIGTKGVRSMKAEIETIWLIRDVLLGSIANILSSETRTRIVAEVAYHLSAQYCVRVTVTTKGEARALAPYAPPTQVPMEHVVGYYEDYDGTQSDEYAWLTLKERSRLARSLEFAMEKEDGLVTAAELRGLHCKEWKDCIHGHSGYASFVDNTVHRYRVFERVKRGLFKITDRGRDLIRDGRLEVPKPKNPLYALTTFVPNRQDVMRRMETKGD